MASRHRIRGITFTEIAIVVTILLVLAAILFPLTSTLKRKAQITASSSKLRQVFFAIQVYRNDYAGAPVFESYRDFYRLGLPNWHGFSYAHILPKASDWQSPCGHDDTIYDWTPGPARRGMITYAGLVYLPEYIEAKDESGRLGRTHNALQYSDYIPTYKDNIVLALDSFCNPPGTALPAPFIKKRGLAVLLSGQLVNKYDYGNAYLLQWWSNPP